MRISLHTRLLLLVAGTVAGLSILALLVVGALVRREVTNSVRRDVRTTGMVLSQLVRERGGALQSRCEILASQPALKQYIFGQQGSAAREDWPTVSGYATECREQLRVGAILITDQEGRPLGESDSTAPDRANRGGEPGIASALRNVPWFGIVPRQSRVSLAATVPISEPVSRTVQGTITAYLDIDSSIAEEMKKAVGSDVAFVQHGHVLGSTIRGLRRIDARSDAPSLVLANGRFLALYAPLPTSREADGVGFVTLVPYAGAMATANRIGTLLGIVSVITLLAALFAGTVVARGITRPLAGVIGAARALQRGEWPERLDTTRADEIGLLQTVFNDMSEAVRTSQERLLALIDKDPLTELDNHRRFQERLAQEVLRAKASGDPLTMLLLDLDHFQQFNHRFGHAAGDDALKRIAATIRRCAPETAILARYGGEEFAILVPGAEMDAAEELAKVIRQTLSGEAEASEPLTVSVGVAEAGADIGESDGLALAAELAVSRAKQLGRDRICRFESSLQSEEHDPQQLHRFLKDGSLATIQALAAAVDAKDAYTRGHSQRVAEYSRDLARRIGLSDEEVELVFITGTLHDVGKIGVPDAILKKPGRLDDEERAVMETHPALGEVIVRKAPQLAATLPGVRHHHERWDGRGYPDGLAGESIPRIARLLALADTFDAMTSDRPYRKGLAVEIALSEIERGRGTQFDPDLAPAFVEMMSQRFQSLAA